MKSWPSVRSTTPVSCTPTRSAISRSLTPGAPRKARQPTFWIALSDPVSRSVSPSCERDVDSLARSAREADTPNFECPRGHKRQPLPCPWPGVSSLERVKGIERGWDWIADMRFCVGFGLVCPGRSGTVVCARHRRTGRWTTRPGPRWPASSSRRWDWPGIGQHLTGRRTRRATHI